MNPQAQKLIKKSLVLFFSVAFIMQICPLIRAELSTGIIHYYTCDNNMTSGTVSIDSLNNYNGTLTGGLTSGFGGKLGQSYNDNAVAEYLAILPSSLNGQSSATFNLWVNKTGNGGAGYGRLFHDGGNSVSCYSEATQGFGDLIDVVIDTSGTNCGARRPYVHFVNNTWVMLTFVYNGSQMNVYVNGTFVYNSTCSGTVVAYTKLQIMSKGTSSEGLYGSFDEIGFWNRSLNSTEISSLYNGGAGLSYNDFAGGAPPVDETPTIRFMPPTPGNNTAQYITGNNTIVTALETNYSEGLNSTIKLYRGGSLINSTPNSTSFNFTSLSLGTYYINASLINPDGSTNTSTETRRIDIYTLIIEITSPVDYEKINRSLNLIFSSITTSSLINITSQNITLRPITNFSIINQSIANLSGTNTSYTWDTYDRNLTTGYWYVALYAYDNYNNNKEDDIIINLTKDAQVNITAKYILDNSTITNYTMNITDLITGGIQSQTTTNNKTSFEIMKNRTYTLTLDAIGYAITSINNSFNKTWANYTIFAYTDNSVSITLIDENTDLIITENITMIFSQNLTQIKNTTTTGTYYQAGLTEGTWIIKFYGQNYALKTYDLTVANRSTQNLNAYLSNSNETTIFTILDFDTGGTLSGAIITQSKLINGSYTVVNVKNSDITGRAQLTYAPSIRYQFLVTITGYNSNLFYLDPVLFSTYNIRMTKTTTLTEETTPDLTGVDISFYNNLTGETTWINNRTNTLIWIISSPIGVIDDYNLTITYPTGSEYRTGNLATGEQFTIPFNITGANISSKVIIAYCYKSTTSYNKCFTFPYSIIGSYANTSMIANKDRTYGLSVIERVIIVTIVTLLVSGLFYTMGGELTGLLISIIVMAFFMKIGFTTLWMNIPSLFIGFIILVRGGKE